MASKIKDKIFESALFLFYEFGFHGTSMKMIIDDAKVSNGGAFHHFKTKDALIIELHRIVKSRYYESIINNLDFECTIKELIFKLWLLKFNWNMDNPKEKYFLEIFKLSSFEADENRLALETILLPLLNRIEQSMESGLIARIDIKYFFIEMDASVDALTRYLDLSKLDINELDIEMYFHRYWKAVLKLV